MFRFYQVTLSILAILVGIASVILGIYAFVILGFFGGIATIVDGFKASPTDPVSLAFGTFKLIFCWVPAVVGVFVAWVAVTFGTTGLTDTRYQK